ncbi:MAG: type III-B CRISPR module-associated protein Cmr3 [bacterium]
MKIFIKPNDTLFFRDGKPFTMGEQTEGSGIFPPFPPTVYGAIRAKYIAEKGGLKKFLNGEMRSEIGTDKEKGAFRIKNILISNNNNTLYPAPRDIVRSSHDGNIHRLVKKENILISPMINLNLLWSCVDGKVEYNEKDYITQDSIISYLEGKDKDLIVINQSNFVVNEPKVGIGRNPKTRTSEESKLYRISMYRLKDGYGLLVDFEGIEISSSGLIRLGGEGKTANYTVTNNEFSINTKLISEYIDRERQFKLYLASPTIFKNGWVPDQLDTKTMIWNYKNLKLRLITTAIGKPINIGGWDIVSNAPKVMRRAVPSGSVYYFELIDGSGAEVLKELNCQNISDFLPEEGFGYCLIGVI